MNRFDTPYATMVAHGNLAARQARDAALARDPLLTPPFDDPAVAIGLAVALVRLGRGRGPSGLGWGPQRPDLRACRWRPGWLWDLTLISPTAGELETADAQGNSVSPAVVPTGTGVDEPEHTGYLEVNGRNAGAHLAPLPALPLPVAELLLAHARRGDGACLAVLGWLARCGLIPPSLAGLHRASPEPGSDFAQRGAKQSSTRPASPEVPEAASHPAASCPSPRIAKEDAHV